MKQNASLISNEILDNILGLLLSFEAPAFQQIFKKTNTEIIDMNFIAKLLNHHQWNYSMKELYKEELLNNHYIMEDENKNLLITQQGRVFKENGGYYSKELNQFQVKDLESDFEIINKKSNRKLNLIVILLFIIQVILIGIIKNLLK